MESKKFLLQEKDIPTAWYNIVADMENKPLPPLNPKTKEPLKPEDLYPLFAKGLVDQEMNMENRRRSSGFRYRFMGSLFAGSS